MAVRRPPTRKSSLSGLLFGPCCALFGRRLVGTRHKDARTFATIGGNCTRAKLLSGRFQHNPRADRLQLTAAVGAAILCDLPAPACARTPSRPASARPLLALSPGFEATRRHISLSPAAALVPAPRLQSRQHSSLLPIPRSSWHPFPTLPLPVGLVTARPKRTDTIVAATGSFQSRTRRDATDCTEIATPRLQDTTLFSQTPWSVGLPPLNTHCSLVA